MLDLNTYVNEIVWWWCWYAKEISWQIVIAVSAYLCVCVFLYFLLKNTNHRPWQIPGPPSRILLVTAHPDDEVMFFGPTIYNIVRDNISQIYILCLTTGGNKQRKEELWDCAKILGIPEGNVTIIMNPELPDDPTLIWPETEVSKIMLNFIETYKINAVLTFDKFGVSGHKNHISLFYAFASMYMEKRVPSYCKLYILESVNIVRKYVQLLDLPISLLSGSYWYFVDYNQRRIIKEAMAAHKSQYVWFRKLYMIFSRYTFINTIQEVVELDFDLDFQLDED
ncbi:N-acetylglucosaminyl-phosphatidylinositol de-N-acetylase [Cephus cinctus]|uniref:N-acetylglucosaminylphosphatidylinositol deacetylase n=1 Tax=Cephus cinctus TaxID=211228 RepID=A0AAJ7BTY2_CEPCN|nr:N-acetylglucosaminyl-phosphatidylinositol de-N-acetylase [Cephus cinctus]